MSILFPIILKKKKSPLKGTKRVIYFRYRKERDEKERKGRDKDVNKITILKIKLHFDVNLEYH